MNENKNNIKLPLCEGGNHDLVLHGKKRTRTGIYQIYLCKKCGAIIRGSRIPENKTKEAVCQSAKNNTQSESSLTSKKGELNEYKEFKL